ncbi:MAG: hypothetical protein R2824_15975 [Saprospiraceae bacterium]
MKVDILLCIDGTGSMEKIIDEVKGNISRFVNNLITNFSDRKLLVESYRIKILVFRNIEADRENWLQETPFYDLGQNQDELNEFLQSVQAIGGSREDPREDSLSALSIGLSNSDWSFGADDFQIIGLWTDNQSKEIGEQLLNYSNRYENVVPTTYQDLKDYWNDFFLQKAPNARLLLFAPDISPWDKVLEEWSQTIHYRSESAGTDHKRPEEFLLRDLFIDLAPSVEDADYDHFAKDHKEEKRDKDHHNEKKPNNGLFQRLRNSFRKKSRAALLTIAIALFSFSLVSFRLIGFSIFSVNLKYTREINNENTEEFKRRLDEIVEILKDQGMLNEFSEIDFNSEIKTRHGLFNDKYDLILRYAIELSVNDYELGQYTISELRETMAGAEIIADHLNIVEKTYSHNGPIDVLVIGETDATPIVGAITYNGSYGKIFSTAFNYENNRYQLEITEGDTISENMELGVLRASELWHYVKSSTNLFIPKPTHVDLSVITHKNFGSLYRRSTIVVKLYDLKALD